MNSANIYRNCIIKQDAMDVGYMTKKGLALTSLLHNLIREYGTYDDNNFCIDVDDLDICDKRLLLSHFQDAEDYEHSCKSVTNTEVSIKEARRFYQQVLDDECYECYISVMEEMRDYR